MKQKRVERVERRRPVVELNLLAADKGNAPTRRRGCMSLVSGGLLALAVLVAPGLAALVALLASGPGQR